MDILQDVERPVHRRADEQVRSMVGDTYCSDSPLYKNANMRRNQLLTHFDETFPELADFMRFGPIDPDNEAVQSRIRNVLRSMINYPTENNY